MQIINEEKFSHDDKEYAIVLWKEDDTYKVRALLPDRRPANGYSYSVDLDLVMDLKSVHEMDAVKLLKKHAVSDIQNGVWEKYLAAVEYFKNNPMPGAPIEGT